jgi:hypothetical protein
MVEEGNYQVKKMEEGRSPVHELWVWLGGKGD